MLNEFKPSFFSIYFFFIGFFFDIFGCLWRYVPITKNFRNYYCQCCFYRVLEEIFDSASVVHNSVKDNRKHWEKICALIKLKRGGSCEQMSYDQILALEEEASKLKDEEVQSVTVNGH